MKRFFTILCLSILLGSCLSESSVDPAAASTFIRYYYGGYNDKAVAFEETPDKGFILLSTVTITASEAVAAKYKIKLIKTDEFGNPQWQKVYPDFTAASATIDYKAKSLQILQNGGYVITGEDIQSDLTSKVFIMTVDETGNVVKKATLPSVASASGQAVAANSLGNYLLLAASSQVNTSGDTEMVLGEVKKDDLTKLW